MVNTLHATTDCPGSSPSSTCNVSFMSVCTHGDGRCWPPCLGSQLVMWEAHTEFQAPGCGLANPSCYKHLGSESANESISLSFSLSSLSAFQKIFKTLHDKPRSWVIQHVGWTVTSFCNLYNPKGIFEPRYL